MILERDPASKYANAEQCDAWLAAVVAEVAAEFPHKIAVLGGDFGAHGMYADYGHKIGVAIALPAAEYGIKQDTRCGTFVPVSAGDDSTEIAQRALVDLRKLVEGIQQRAAA